MYLSFIFHLPTSIIDIIFYLSFLSFTCDFPSIYLAFTSDFPIGLVIKQSWNDITSTAWMVCMTSVEMASISVGKVIFTTFLAPNRFDVSRSETMVMMVSEKDGFFGA